ncbi:outer membrane beta-barrel protein [Sinomicrobium oceani]|nr:outer membrane beta-barrel protein [Sinomicrobium oceani]
MKNTVAFISPILLTLVMVLVSARGMAQNHNEVSVYISGPFQSLRTDAGSGGAYHARNGGSLGIGYGYAFSENWSVLLHAEVQFYSSAISYGQFSDAYETTDIEGDTFEFRYTFSGYKEKQKAYFVEIPLMLQYTSPGVNTRFYAAAGVGIGFSVDATYSADYSKLSTSGYYSQWDAELQAPKFMGFGNFGKGSVASRDLELKNTYMLKLETGIKQVLNDKNALYLGVYLNYGLNDLSEDKSATASVLTYQTDNPSEFDINTLLYSGNTRSDSKLRAVGFGLKLRYGFSW